MRELHAQKWSRNRIAKEVGLSGSTVSGIIRSTPGASFDRTDTRAATEARVADTAATRAELAERRARLSAELLGDAERLRAMLWKPYTHGQFGGKDNVWSSVDLDRPPVAEQRTILSALHSAIRDHVELERLDSDNGVADSVGVLGDILAGVRAAYAEQSAAQTSALGVTPAEESGEPDQNGPRGPEGRKE